MHRYVHIIKPVFGKVWQQLHSRPGFHNRGRNGSRSSPLQLPHSCSWPVETDSASLLRRHCYNQPVNCTLATPTNYTPPNHPHPKTNSLSSAVLITDLSRSDPQGKGGRAGRQGGEAYPRGMAGPWHKMGRESWSSCVSVSRLGSKPGQAEIFYDLGMDEFWGGTWRNGGKFCEGCEGYRTAVLVYAVFGHVGCNVMTLWWRESSFCLRYIVKYNFRHVGHSKLK